MKFPSIGDYYNQKKAGLKSFFSTRIPLPAFFQYGKMFIRIEDAKHVEVISLSDGAKFVKQACEDKARTFFDAYRWQDLERKGFTPIDEQEYINAKNKAA